MTDIVVALTTLPAGFDAPALARALVTERLAACVAILPQLQSVYEWEGAVTVDAEQQLVIKTARDRVGPLWDRLRALHPYQVPEFLVLPVESGHPDYLTWVRGSVGGKG